MSNVHFIYLSGWYAAGTSDTFSCQVVTTNTTPELELDYFHFFSLEEYKFCCYVSYPFLLNLASKQ